MRNIKIPPKTLEKCEIIEEKKVLVSLVDELKQGFSNNKGKGWYCGDLNMNVRIKKSEQPCKMIYMCLKHITRVRRELA